MKAIIINIGCDYNSLIALLKSTLIFRVMRRK